MHHARYMHVLFFNDNANADAEGASVNVDLVRVKR